MLFRIRSESGIAVPVGVLALLMTASGCGGRLTEEQPETCTGASCDGSNAGGASSSPEGGEGDDIVEGPEGSEGNEGDGVDEELEEEGEVEPPGPSFLECPDIDVAGLITLTGCCSLEANRCGVDTTPGVGMVPVAAGCMELEQPGDLDATCPTYLAERTAVGDVELAGCRRERTGLCGTMVDYTMNGLPINFGCVDPATLEDLPPPQQPPPNPAH